MLIRKFSSSPTYKVARCYTGKILATLNRSGASFNGEDVNSPD